jgi:hypothetical protein
MRGPLQAAGQIKRVWRLIRNPRFSPATVQASLIHCLVGNSQVLRFGSETVVMVAMDWVDYDNGRVKGLRVNLVTGSRALPLLWYETLASEMKKTQTALQERAVRDLILHRPPHIKWLILLDSGFMSSALLDLLHMAGFFIVRTRADRLVHGQDSCWSAIKNLPIRVGQIVDFGWVHHAASNSRVVRLVLARIYAGTKSKQPRRRSQLHRYKYSQPGLCAVTTNLPRGAYSPQQVIRLYARRFEIEHHFRDLKNASLGMDHEHCHLKNIEAYGRLMAIIAVAEACLWLSGTDLEQNGLHRHLSVARPAKPRRDISIRNVACEYLGLRSVDVERLIACHLGPALPAAHHVVSRHWKQLVRVLKLENLAESANALSPLGPRCRHRGSGAKRVHELVPNWPLQEVDGEGVGALNAA